VDLPKTSLKKDWILTQAAFDRFLTILDEDREKAGEKYEYIRLRLLKYFQWGGSEAPDIDVDETMNRVTRRIDEGANVYNLNGYIYGVAKLVRTESLKVRNLRQEFDEAKLIELSSLGIDSEAGQRRECLDRCLRRLNDEDREIITEYYKHDKRDRITCRKQLARRLGIASDNLRVRTHRLRLSLETCVERCLGRYE
jgi:DNA-directed RNA polymerase specialized sigma24 family protein